MFASFVIPDRRKQLGTVGLAKRKAFPSKASWTEEGK